MSRLLAASAVLILGLPNACQNDEPLHWRYTCGEPVCQGFTPKPGIPLCTSEAYGNRCEHEEMTCDPRDDCNRVLLCSPQDPGVLPCPDRP